MPVVNKPGASKPSTPRSLAAATADGYKIAVQNASLFTITPLAVSAAEATSIDTFDVITGVSRDDYVMATNPKTGFTTIEDMKKSGKTIREGTTGVGTGAQALLGADLQDGRHQRDRRAVRRRRPGPDALLGNQVDVSTMQIGRPSRTSRRASVPLAVFSADRISYLPEVPTAKEQGFDVQVTQYRFLTAPKGTPERPSCLLEFMRKTSPPRSTRSSTRRTPSPRWRSLRRSRASLEADSEKYQQQLKQYGISLAG